MAAMAPASAVSCTEPARGLQFLSIREEPAMYEPNHSSLDYRLGRANLHRAESSHAHQASAWLAVVGIVAAVFVILRAMGLRTNGTQQSRPQARLRETSTDPSRTYCPDGCMDVVHEASESSF